MSDATEQPLRALQVYKGLVEVSALINAITDFSELLAAILDVAVRVMDAEAASLFLTNDDGNLKLVIARGLGGREAVNAHIIVPRGHGVAGWVLEHRKSSLVTDAYSDPRFYPDVDRKTGFRTRSIVCVPLMQREKEIGVLQVLNPKEKNAFDEVDLEAFEAYGNLVATAIEKLRTIDREKEQARVDQELALAREIQSSFLPQTLPSLPKLGFAASYRPARNIGGDFYDVLEIGPDEIYFVVGDVSGKGIPAALLMAQSISTLRLIIKAGVSPVNALTRWNEMLCGHTIRGMFITAILGRITPSRRLVELSSAGHCKPFLAGLEKQVSELQVDSAPPIGILPGLSYQLTSVTVSPGEWLVFYTDGLTESFNTENELLESRGVQQLLSQHQFNTAEEVVEALRKGEMAHRGGADPHDDLTTFVFGFR